MQSPTKEIEIEELAPEVAIAVRSVVDRLSTSTWFVVVLWKSIYDISNICVVRRALFILDGTSIKVHEKGTRGYPEMLVR